MLQFRDGPPDASVVAGLGKIDELINKSDKKGLLAFASSLEIKYHPFTDKTDEYDLLGNVANALMLPRVYNGRPLPNKQVPLSLALYLLRQKDIPLDIASERVIAVLTFFIQETPSGDSLPVKERLEYTGLALKLLQRIDLAISPSFDPNEVLGYDDGFSDVKPNATDVPPMPSEQVFMRMNDIPYHQRQIYRLRETYKPRLVICLGYLYAQPPKNVPELVRLMNEYHMTSSFQSDVLAQVKVDQNGGVFSSP
jgi:hypothetical protein